MSTESRRSRLLVGVGSRQGSAWETEAEGKRLAKVIQWQREKWKSLSIQVVVVVGTMSKGELSAFGGLRLESVGGPCLSYLL